MRSDLVTDFLMALAQQAPAGQAGGGSGLFQLAPLVLIFGVFYLLIIRPQSKKAKQHQEMLSQLKAGDRVVTQGGILGRITGIKDDEVTLEVQQGVRLRVLRSAVSGRQKETEPPKAEAKAS